MQTANGLSEQALQIAKKKKNERQWRKGVIHDRIQSTREQQGEIRKTSEQCKEIEKDNRMGISSRKQEIPVEHFMQRWAQ